MDGFDGTHIIIDAVTKDQEFITIEHVYDFLLTLTEQAGMSAVHPPVVSKFPFRETEKEENSGITGIVVWTESHASIHTWSRKQFINFDAFSCKRMNVDRIVDIFISFFRPVKISVSCLDRQLDHGIFNHHCKKVQVPKC